ncbi:MAG TPA: hypothetical protein VJ653_08250, partial [Acidimicrobiales bacterium]|nr:hypothetical protein [Acidimicrobiales bacterium]
MLSDETIGQTLRRHADPQQAADTLVDMANQAGGDDNITVVILDVLGDGNPAAATAAAERPVEPAPPMAPEEPEPIEEPDDSGPVPPPAGRGLRNLVLWGLPILAVIGIGIGAVGWYARRTYYVGLSADRVTLFKGVPGGLLGWNPTIDRQTDLTAADLTEADRADLDGGHRFASKTDANRFIERLQQAHEALAGTTTTTEPGVSATGVPPESPPDTTETSR